MSPSKIGDTCRNHSVTDHRCVWLRSMKFAEPAKSTTNERPEHYLRNRLQSLNHWSTMFMSKIEGVCRIHKITDQRWVWARTEEIGCNHQNVYQLYVWLAPKTYVGLAKSSRNSRWQENRRHTQQPLTHALTMFLNTSEKLHIIDRTA